MDIVQLFSIECHSGSAKQEKVGHIGGTKQEKVDHIGGTKQEKNRP